MELIFYLAIIRLCLQVVNTSINGYRLHLQIEEKKERKQKVALQPNLTEKGTAIKEVEE